MAKGNGNDLERLLTSVRAKVTDIHDLPGGWPGNIELALIDAVLSIRSRYGVSEETGVRGAIKRYKSDSGRASWDDLTSLAETDPDRLTAVLANKQKTGGVLKVEAIISAAERLTAVGVNRSADLDPGSASQRRAYCGTRGLGPVTWAYFLMLVGYDGVKADTLVTRFVEQAVDRKLDVDTVTALVMDAAQRLDIPASRLDHAIWRHMSNPRRS